MALPDSSKEERANERLFVKLQPQSSLGVTKHHGSWIELLRIERAADPGAQGLTFWVLGIGKSFEKVLKP